MGANVSKRNPSSQVSNFHIYKCIPSLQSSRHEITCMAAYDDYVILGTEDGCILKGTLNDRLLLDPKLDIISRTKSPVVQIEVFPELRIIISLSDNVISVRALNFAHLPFAVDETRGATSFVTTGNGNILKMCVVIRNRLVLFYWMDDNFYKLSNDLLLQDIPKAVAWFNDYICVCLNDEYTVIDYETGDKKELYKVSSGKPLIKPLEYRSELALGFGNETGLVRLREGINVHDLNAESTISHPIIWANSPINILDDIPYLVALSPKSIIEVQTVEPRLVVQKFSGFPTQSGHLKLLVKCTNKKGRFFAASSSDVYCLTPEPLGHQIQQLLSQRHFQLALNLNEESDETQESRNRRTKEIEYQHALDCVEQKDMKQSLDIFRKINADPIRVLEFFFQLLGVIYPGYPLMPHLNKDELKEAFDNLISYSLDIQSCTRNDKILSTLWPDLDSKAVREKKIELNQIVDNFLLQCYLKKDDNLRIAALLRHPDNNCDIEESKRALIRHGKFNELIIFYQSKGLHCEALDLLKEKSTHDDPSLAGHEPTVNYLQRLGPDNLDLIFLYTDWVIKEHPADGLKIFSDDKRHETDHLPKDKVLEYLERTNESLVIFYLEDVILNGCEPSPNLENILILTKYSPYLESTVANKAPLHHSDEKELKIIDSLIRYLLAMRDSVLKYTKDGKLTNFWPDLDLEAIAEKKATLERMIDTMLLQCFLKNDDHFRIEALIVLPDNHCDVEKSEMALKQYGKYKELKILYQSHGLHRKALNLLKVMSTQSDPLLVGPKPTVDYLQNLGANHLELIFEYATWVLEKHPKDGLKIFSGSARSETAEGKKLPKEEVIAYLERTNESLAILYLEDIILNGGESTQQLENTLIHKYLERAQALISDKFNAMRERRTTSAHVSDHDEIDVLRRFSLLRKAIGLKENSQSGDF
ncbi:Vam6/Vps39-like protein [Halotydeus destructor]|nr:Vam6/Vps39-like protein [Halotydeus destructor]